MRDMEIIQNELRLKDIEWVQKQIDGLKKSGRSLGNTSLADKARKEEIVRASPCGLSAQEEPRLPGYRRESTQVFKRR
jgi:ribosome-binding ATPase YchF (GTP1/OBG family)